MSEKIEYVCEFLDGSEWWPFGWFSRRESAEKRLHGTAQGYERRLMHVRTEESELERIPADPGGSRSILYSGGDGND